LALAGFVKSKDVPGVWTIHLQPYGLK
jgi:hypothetical protein